MPCRLPILRISGIFVRIKEIANPRSISVPSDILAKSVSLSQFWSPGALCLVMVCLTTIVIYRLFLLHSFLKVLRYQALPYCFPNSISYTYNLLKYTSTHKKSIELILKSVQTYIADDLEQVLTFSVQLLIYEMGICSGSHVLGYIRITWRVCEKKKVECWAFHRVSDSVGLVKGLRICISDKGHRLC